MKKSPSTKGAGVQSGLSEQSKFNADGKGMGDVEKRKQPKPTKGGGSKG